jgi:regulator of sirC expression with transglutaminase-like and TPR domain
MTRLIPWSCIAFLLLSADLPADEKPKAAEPPTRTVEQLAEQVRPSIVVVTVAGRDGKQHGLGTGFVVGDGLIATNLHVIGEARPIGVEMADGKKFDVTAVHATDRAADLAVIRINAPNLTPLPLGDSDTLKDGEPIMAMGNPQGLKHSVVSGVVSGKRVLDGRPMIQLAIPIEQGNSGGPMLDMQGRVHGILTIKSLVTPNLGFAVPVTSLKRLLEKPNPIVMDKWLTIGALDPREWQPVAGARWRQRSGHILAEGMGEGFGGRSLLLYQGKLPELPFEVGVTVRLEDEAGAAGLVFHADGKDRHYGFYPSGGNLRFVRFEGPDVFAWKILAHEYSPYYRRGDWNTIKVRIDKDRIRCFVNDELAIESNDTGLTQGQVGLAKFRDTRAEFKNFRVAREIPPDRVPAEVAERIRKVVADIPADQPPKGELVQKLAPEGPAGMSVLRERAKMLEQQATRLRQLALAIHQKEVLDELGRLVAGPEDRIDLLHAALLIARLDNEEVNVGPYLQQVERMTREINSRLPKEADEKAKREELNRFLFEESGFHGSRSDYYHRSNSYLNEVIDDREGLPITLSVLYMEMARRLGLKVVGVPLPGHFMVRHEPKKGPPQLIDVYEGGKALSRAEAEARIRDITGEPLRDEDFTAADKKAILVRMFHNLLRLARGDEDAEGMLRYLNGILLLDADAGYERWMRAVLCWQTGRRTEASADVDRLLATEPDGVDLKQVRELRRLLNQPGR